MLTQSFSRLSRVAALAVFAWLCFGNIAIAEGGAKTPEEFAKLYMAAFNAKDSKTLDKLRYPVQGKSPMQEMLAEIAAAEMTAGTKYTQFEVLPLPKDMDKPHMGPDGKFYRPNIIPTNLLKVTSQSENGSTSCTFPIGLKDGTYYTVGLELAHDAMPAFISGWQRCALPKTDWSVLLPNEPEPGRAALELQAGKDALNDPDLYGVVKNTADIKTCQHWMHCGEEGRRVSDDKNQETYRAACTTYTPETLQKWFNDQKKNIEDAVDYMVRRDDGKLISQKSIELKGAPGKEIEIGNKDGSKCLARVYWIKDALYELTFMSKKDKPDLVGANKFLGSLEVK